MTKADLIEKIAKDAGISKVAAGSALQSFMDNVSKTLKKPEGKVTLVGFGTFAMAVRPARNGYNPHTKQPMKIRAIKTIRFKPGAELRGLA